jgi:hypothetical protein
MQVLQRLGIFGWGKHVGRHRFVVRPHVDHEAVMHVDAWLDPRFEHSYSAVGLRKPSSKLNLHL